jgi:hypothetical protein
MAKSSNKLFSAPNSAMAALPRGVAANLKGVYQLRHPEPCGKMAKAVQAQLDLLQAI